MSNHSIVLSSALDCDLAGVKAEFTPWSKPIQVAAYLQRVALLKKYQGDIDALADQRALEKFLSVNTSCANWEPRWALCEDELIGTVKDCIAEFWSGPAGLNPLVTTISEIFNVSYSGPGASIGATGNDFYSKFYSSTLTTADRRLYSWYTACIKNHPTWHSAESFRACHLGLVEHVEGSRLCFVPKTNNISRLICIEPSLNGFFQLGFGAKLTARLNRFFGIDFGRQQEISRELARLGSLDDGEKSYVTIDLESASDSMSLKMLKHFLPRDFLAWLEVLRCPKAKAPDGTSVDLSMVSTMGNGFTFPLQTMLFACVVAGVYKYRGVKLEKSGKDHLGNFSVFGDDIIVTKQLSRDILRVLGHLGFVVNASKTFVEGPFRESCGRDYFRGHDVRPVFIKKLDSAQDRYAAINTLHEWCAKTNLSLSTCTSYLRSTVRYNPVPHWDNVDAGIRVPSSLLGRMRRCKRTGSVMYRRYTPKASYLLFSEDSVHGRGKRRLVNPNGMMMCLLHGSIVDGRTAVRLDGSLYRAKWSVAPSWDNGPPGLGVAPSQWQRWETAVWTTFVV